MSGPNPMPAKYAANKAFCAFGLATFTIGTKQTNTINVGVQLNDNHNVAIAQIAHAKVYLSDNSDGSTLTGTATSSALAIGTNGVILDTPVSGKIVDVISNAAGKFDLNVIQTASPTTYYMVIECPDGSIIVSSAITF